MNKNKELVKNTLIITIGKVGTQLIGFLLLPLYTSILSTKEYGIVDLINAYAQLLMPIVICQMDQALLRFMINERGSIEGIKKCVTTAYVFFVIQIVLFSVIFAAFDWILSKPYAIFLYIIVLSMCISNYAFQTARGIGDNLTYSIASFRMYSAIFKKLDI